MPPRSHSSSSRSSSSRSSSSRSSSSRSSSSRSSSSRSSSSRSSSSYSSSSRSYSGSSSPSRGPGRHSTSSRSSTPVYSGRSYASKPAGPIPQRPAPTPHRPRVNQPIGYMIAGALSPKYYYGGRHDYVYYPDSWTDSDTGTYYEKGYYDENGTRYDNVAFAKNGKYENVVCHCEYCGRDTVLNLDAAADALTDLKCPGCTAPLTIRSELDEIVEEDPGAAAYSYAPTPVKKKKKKWPWILAIFVGLYLLGESELAKQEAEQGNPGTTQQIEYTENTGVQFGSRIGLVKTGENTYTYSDSSSADKTLVWDSDADSYYDRDSDCWLWYNTDVSPSIWQYWYEGISSDYEESGWMEHDAGGWGIEVADGQWIDLPEKYSTDRLWYIQD